MQPPSPITPAQLAFDASGALISARYGDIYASAGGAFDQARHVFLAGNDLPQRWRQRGRFVIVETGFGAGVNFLATLECWRAHAPAAGRLHYVAVEKHPFVREDLALALAHSGASRALVNELLAQYPLPLAGFHRLSFDCDRLTLTLLFGDAVEMLSELNARADAFFLAGFAPGKNPQMWSDALFAELARLAAPDATVATYTVAGLVREGLRRAGFHVTRSKGFAAKREMLRAQLAGRAVPEMPAMPHQAVVIGAGLAGSACAAALAMRAVDVEVIECHERAAQEASGNPAGLVMPAFSVDWNMATRFTVSAFLYAMRRSVGMPADAWHPSGVLQLARDEAHLARQLRIIEHFALPTELIRMVSSADGAQLAGTRVAGTGWWMSGAGWAHPAGVCEASLANARCKFGQRACALRRCDDGQWDVLSQAGLVLARAPVVIIANAHRAATLLPECPPPLGVTRGQVSLVPALGEAQLRAPVCREGYVTPAQAGLHCVGASYAAGSAALDERLEDHVGNLERLARLLPDYAGRIDATRLSGRVALRAVARDRMPIAGPAAPHLPGLYLCVGLASRGLTTAPLLAETIASTIAGEPGPLERSVAAKLSAARFA